MAWGRVLKVVARTPVSQSGTKWTYTETEIQALHLDCSITRSRIFNDNEATVTIYNAAADTYNRILRRGSNVSIFAGYEDEGDAGLIFQGNIIDSATARAGADVVTVIRAKSLRSIDKPFTATPVALSFPKGTTADKVMESLATTLGLVPIGLEVAGKVTLPGTWTYVGGIGGALERLGRDLRAQGCGLYIDLAELVCYSIKADSTYSVAVLAPTSGLLELRDTSDYMMATRATIDTIGEKMDKDAKEAEKAKKDKKKKKKLTTSNSYDLYAELDKAWTSVRKTYEAQCIVLPSVKPNSLVQVKAWGVDGLFVVDAMKVEAGNTPGSQFTMTLSLVEA